MRKAFLHEEVLLRPFVEHFRRLGAAVHREHPVRVGDRLGFIDLFVEIAGERIACEAELTAQRAANDVHKARAANATWLVIVTPTRHVARRARERCLGVSRSPTVVHVSVLPLGPALGLIRDCFPLISIAFPDGKANGNSTR